MATMVDDARTFNGAPERSLAQRMEALHHANEIRSDRAQLKRDLKAGREHVVPLLLDPPDYLANMKLFDLLLAVPKCGRVKVGTLLRHAQVSPSKTVGGVSPRQRAQLVKALRPYARRSAPAPDRRGTVADGERP